MRPRQLEYRALVYYDAWGSVRKCLRNTGDVRGDYLIIQVAGILLHIRGVSTVLETDVVIIHQSIRIGLTACIETIRC